MGAWVFGICQAITGHHHEPDSSQRPCTATSMTPNCILDQGLHDNSISRGGFVKIALRDIPGGPLSQPRNERISANGGTLPAGRNPGIASRKRHEERRTVQLANPRAAPIRSRRFGTGDRIALTTLAATRRLRGMGGQVSRRRCNSTIFRPSCVPAARRLAMGRDEQLGRMDTNMLSRPVLDARILEFELCAVGARFDSRRLIGRSSAQLGFAAHRCLATDGVHRVGIEPHIGIELGAVAWRPRQFHRRSWCWQSPPIQWHVAKARVAIQFENRLVMIRR